MRKAFTLIEVMIAVLIISTVIMALLQMRANGSHIFMKLFKQKEINQYATFVISNKNYGFENEKVSLDKLLDEFDMESELRRKLKKVKIEIFYQEVKLISFREDMNFEIGKTIIKTPKSSFYTLRLRSQ